jgi:3-dehydroquinate dehydratase-2
MDTSTTDALLVVDTAPVATVAADNNAPAVPRATSSAQSVLPCGDAIEPLLYAVDVVVALISLLHGPNLNLLGQREPTVYGTATLDDYVETVRRAAARHGMDVEALQTNHEGVLVDAIHAARGHAAAIIINPGAFTHYAWSLHDALAAFDGPVLEVHISNPNARECWLGTHTTPVSVSSSVPSMNPPHSEARRRSTCGSSSSTVVRVLRARSPWPRHRWRSRG